MKYYVSIDIGGTSIKYGVMDEQGTIVAKASCDTEAAAGGPAIVQKVLGIVEDYRSQYELSGVCISTAGMVDVERGEIFFAGPQIPNYIGTNWRDIIREHFDLPCEVENDVNCAGLAEAKCGAAVDSQVCLCLTIGTGIGGCAVIGGQVFHGASGSGCEVGYMTMHGSTFQELAAASVLSKKVAQRKNSTPEEMNGRVIFDLARAGDEVCIQEIDHLVQYLAEGIANICYVLNPDTVVLGGGIMAETEYLGPRLDRVLDEVMVPAIRKHTKIAFAQNRNNAGMLGAFYHFKQRHG